MRLTNTTEKGGFHREKICPWKSVGVSVTARPLAWGDPKVVVKVDEIRENYGYDVIPSGALVPYYVQGIILISIANPTIPTTWNVFQIHKSEDIGLTATSGAGEASPDEIYLTDASTVEVYDLIWIADTNSSDGEIRRVEAIAGNTLDLDANLNNTYTIAADAKLYIIRRGGVARYSAHWGKFAAGGVKNIRTQLFFDSKLLQPGDGVLAGTYGLTADDPSSTLSFTVLFDSF